MSRDPLSHVRRGDPLRISAGAWNAFVDAAKAERRRSLSSERGDEPFPDRSTILVQNATGSDLPRFAVVAVRDPVTTRATREASFLNQGSMIGTIPSFADRGKLAILQEPVRDGAIGRAVATGLTVAKVKVLAPVSAPDLWADVDENQTAHLLGAPKGCAEILWMEPQAERADPLFAWCVVRMGPAAGESFNVKLEIDGGAAGSASTTCSWTYKCKTLNGKVFATTMTPRIHRIPNTPYAETPVDSIGDGFYNEAGEFELFNANERIAPEDCSGQPTSATIDGGTP